MSSGNSTGTLITEVSICARKEGLFGQLEMSCYALMARKLTGWHLPGTPAVEQEGTVERGALAELAEPAELQNSLHLHPPLGWGPVSFMHITTRQIL